MAQRMFRKPGYELRVKAQTEAWAEGNPQHNEVDDECTPDFSCCRRHLLADEAVRREFASADPKKRIQYLGIFLGSLAADTGKKVHVAGTDTGEN